MSSACQECSRPRIRERAAASAIRHALRAHLTALRAWPVAARGVRRTSLRVAMVRLHRGKELEAGFVGLGALLGR
jgi:hypothetical protein